MKILLIFNFFLQVLKEVKLNLEGLRKKVLVPVEALQKFLLKTKLSKSIMSTGNKTSCVDQEMGLGVINSRTTEVWNVSKIPVRF
jgi:hypothetical protein